MTQLLGAFSGWQAPIASSWHFGKQVASTAAQKSWNLFSQLYAAMPCTRKKQPSDEAEFQPLPIATPLSPIHEESTELRQEIRSAVSATMLDIEKIKKQCISNHLSFDKMHQARTCITELEKCRAFLFNKSTPQDPASDLQGIRDGLRALLNSTINAADLEPLKERLQHLNKLMLQANY